MRTCVLGQTPPCYRNVIVAVDHSIIANRTVYENAFSASNWSNVTLKDVPFKGDTVYLARKQVILKDFWSHFCSANTLFAVEYASSSWLSWIYGYCSFHWDWSGGCRRPVSVLWAARQRFSVPKQRSVESGKLATDSTRLSTIRCAVCELETTTGNEWKTKPEIYSVFVRLGHCHFVFSKRSSFDDVCQCVDCFAVQRNVHRQRSQRFGNRYRLRWPLFALRIHDRPTNHHAGRCGNDGCWWWRVSDSARG